MPATVRRSSGEVNSVRMNYEIVDGVPRIRVADGRSFPGLRPEEIVSEVGEAPFIRRLADQLRGLAEVRLPAGRADVATSSHVFEVEPMHQWRTGVRQAYGYAAMSGLKPGLALFGRGGLRGIYREMQQTMPGAELLAWDDVAEAWHRCDSESAIDLVRPLTSDDGLGACFTEDQLMSVLSPEAVDCYLGWRGLDQSPVQALENVLRAGLAGDRTWPAFTG